MFYAQLHHYVICHTTTWGKHSVDLIYPTSLPYMRYQGYTSTLPTVWTRSVTWQLCSHIHHLIWSTLGLELATVLGNREATPARTCTSNIMCLMQHYTTWRIITCFNLWIRDRSIWFFFMASTDCWYSRTLINNIWNQYTFAVQIKILIF